MTPEEIETRFRDLMLRVTSGGAQAQDELITEIRAFAGALGAETGVLTPEDHAEIVRALQGFLDLLEEPGLAEHLTEANEPPGDREQ